MCYCVKLYFVGLLLPIFVQPLLSSYDYQSPHPSMEALARPGLLPKIDVFLNRWGSMHTMREYIYWAITEERISKTLQEKLKPLICQKTLIQLCLKQELKQNPKASHTHVVNLIGTMINSIKDLSYADLDTKQVLKLSRGKSYGLWTDSRDMYLSITGLVMFQKVYLWPPMKFFKDITITTSYQASLTEKHTLVIGMCSLYQRMYTFAVEWLEASQSIARKTADVGTRNRNAFIAIDLIKQIRDLSIQEHNKRAGELDCWLDYECHMYLYTEQILYTSRNAYQTRLSRRKKMLPTYSRLGTVGIAEDQLINLCSGTEQSLLPPLKQVNLKCYNEKRRHPYLYIGPVKTEQLSESPLVFQYYDILGANLIEDIKAHYVKNADIPVLVNNVEYYNRNRLFERVDPTPGYVINITGKYDGHPIFNKFAEMVTGIKFDGPAENLQYMSYVPGRGIRAHEDTNRAFQRDPEKEIDGNRFADLLYYLELPYFGGHTPFCQAGVRAHLVKGSMVLWINKFRNGSNRNDAFHGACPVIHGHKMILAQGLKYTGQENHFKCSLNRFE